MAQLQKLPEELYFMYTLRLPDDLDPWFLRDTGLLAEILTKAQLHVIYFDTHKGKHLAVMQAQKRRMFEEALKRFSRALHQDYVLDTSQIEGRMPSLRNDEMLKRWSHGVKVEDLVHPLPPPDPWLNITRWVPPEDETIDVRPTPDPAYAEDDRAYSYSLQLSSELCEELLSNEARLHEMKSRSGLAELPFIDQDASKVNLLGTKSAIFEWFTFLHDVVKSWSDEEDRLDCTLPEFDHTLCNKIRLRGDPEEHIHDLEIKEQAYLLLLWSPPFIARFNWLVKTHGLAHGSLIREKKGHICKVELEGYPNAISLVSPKVVSAIKDFVPDALGRQAKPQPACVLPPQSTGAAAAGQSVRDSFQPIDNSMTKSLSASISDGNIPTRPKADNAVQAVKKEPDDSPTIYNVQLPIGANRWLLSWDPTPPLRQLSAVPNVRYIKIHSVVPARPAMTIYADAASTAKVIWLYNELSQGRPGQSHLIFDSSRLRVDAFPHHKVSCSGADTGMDTQAAVQGTSFTPRHFDEGKLLVTNRFRSVKQPSSTSSVPEGPEELVCTRPVSPNTTSLPDAQTVAAPSSARTQSLSCASAGASLADAGPSTATSSRALVNAEKLDSFMEVDTMNTTVPEDWRKDPSPAQSDPNAVVVAEIRAKPATPKTNLQAIAADSNVFQDSSMIAEDIQRSACLGVLESKKAMEKEVVVIDLTDSPREQAQSLPDLTKFPWCTEVIACDRQASPKRKADSMEYKAIADACTPAQADSSTEKHSRISVPIPFMLAELLQKTPDHLSNLKQQLGCQFSIDVDHDTIDLTAEHSQMSRALLWLQDYFDTRYANLFIPRQALRTWFPSGVAFRNPLHRNRIFFCQLDLSPGDVQSLKLQLEEGVNQFISSDCVLRQKGTGRICLTGSYSGIRSLLQSILGEAGLEGARPISDDLLQEFDLNPRQIRPEYSATCTFRVPSFAKRLICGVGGSLKDALERDTGSLLDLHSNQLLTLSARFESDLKLALQRIASTLQRHWSNYLLPIEITRQYYMKRPESLGTDAFRHGQTQVCVIPFSAEAKGHIIGHKGVKIKDIRAQTGCIMEVLNNGLLEFYGEWGAIRKALCVIADMLTSYSSTTYEIPPDIVLHFDLVTLKHKPGRAGNAEHDTSRLSRICIPVPKAAMPLVIGTSGRFLTWLRESSSCFVEIDDGCKATIEGPWTNIRRALLEIYGMLLDRFEGNIDIPENAAQHYDLPSAMVSAARGSKSSRSSHKRTSSKERDSRHKRRRSSRSPRRH